MGRIKQDKITYNELIITDKGEQVSSRTVSIGQSEPEYVKLYIDCLFIVKGLRKGLSPIFMAFLPYMSYADANDTYKGQLLYLNKALKMQIAQKLEIKIDSVNKALTDFVKAGIIKRVALGTYQVNPYIVGKGEWKDIKNIRASFDFRSKDVIADIIKGEDNISNK